MTDFNLKVCYPERPYGTDSDIFAFRFRNPVTIYKFRNVVDSVIARLADNEFECREDHAEAIADAVCDELGGVWDSLSIAHTIDINE